MRVNICEYVNFSGDPWKSAALVTLRHADCSSGAIEQYNALQSYNTNNVALRRKIFISAMPRTLIRGPAISIYQGLREILTGGTPTRTVTDIMKQFAFCVILMIKCS